MIELDELLAAKADAVADLEAAVEGLDLSYASLDRVEVHLRSLSAGKARPVAPRVVAYAGDVLIANAGGRWAKGPDAHDLVCVTGMRGCKNGKFLPINTVTAVLLGNRWPGHLREEVESFDIPHQEGRVAALAGDLPATLRDLRASAKAIAGKDPGALAPSVDALTRLVPALAKARTAEADPALRRRVWDGAAILVGHLQQEAMGRAEWTVEAGARDIDRGQWRLFGRIPRHLVSRTPSAELRAKVEAGIAARLAKKKKS